MREHVGTYTLILLNVVALPIMVLYGDPGSLSLGGSNISNPLVFISYMFLHNSTSHLVSNMIALFLQGRVLERRSSTVNMLKVYFFSGILGGALWLGFNFSSTLGGASGATIGLAAYNMIISPGRSLLNEIPLVDRISVPGKLLFTASTVGALQIAVNLQMLWGDSGTVGVLAHIGGIIGGLLMALVSSESSGFGTAIVTGYLTTALMMASGNARLQALSPILLLILVLTTRIHEFRDRR